MASNTPLNNRNQNQTFIPANPIHIQRSADHLSEELMQRITQPHNPLFAHEIREFSQSELSVVARTAAQSGHTQALKIIFEKDESVLSKMILEAITNNNRPAIQNLLSDNRQLDEADLCYALSGAAQCQNPSIINDLLSSHGAPKSKNPILSELWSKVVKNLAKHGYGDMIQLFFNTGRNIFRTDLLDILNSAVENNQPEIVKVLLSGKNEITGTEVYTMLESSVKNGKVSILNDLLSNIKNLTYAQLSTLVLHAAKSNQPEAIRALISNGRKLKPEQLFPLLQEQILKRRNTEIIQALLSDRSQIKPDKLAAFVQMAVLSKNYQAIQALLSDDRHLYLEDMKTIVESTIQNASLNPLSDDSSFFDNFLSNGRNLLLEDWFEIFDTYDLSNTQFYRLEDLAMTYCHDNPSSGIDKDGWLYFTFEDLKNRPEYFLGLITYLGFPNSMLLQNSEAMDTGGLTKEVISTLIKILVEKNLNLQTAHNIPLATTNKDKKLLENLGILFSKVYEKNTSRSDPILLGPIFSSHFYNIIQQIAKTENLKEQRKIVVNQLVETDPNYKALQMVILDPTDEHKADYASIEGFEDEEVSDSYQAALETVDQYVLAANQFLKGMSSDLLNRLNVDGPEQFKTLMQGSANTSENILNALVSDNFDPHHLQWIQEKIENSDEQWKTNFVNTITGQRSLTANTKIELRNHTNDQISIATCFNRIDIPRMIQDKQVFLDVLESSLGCNSYNDQ